MNTTLDEPRSIDLEKRAVPERGHEPPPAHSWNSPSGLWQRKTTVIAGLSVVAIVLHLVLRFGFHTIPGAYQIPLLAILVLGGLPLLYDLLRKLLKREFGSDLLGGISVITSLMLGEYLAGSLIVLMLSGGEALESYALHSASSVLAALAKRMPSIAHRKLASEIVDVGLRDVAVGDTLVIYPHDICPVDGVVIEGHGVMDESYLTGEPFRITKTAGSTVISGAINGESAMIIRTTQRAADSRYARIMEVMRESEARRPQLRRLGDQLGAIYTPVALTVAALAWALSGEAIRFLAVLVIATPCPLLIAIPIAIIGSVSLAARVGIIVKNPAVLENISECRTAIFDKTGTLTFGRPKLTDILPAEGFREMEVLTLVASLERYSKHPLSGAILEAATEKGIALQDASEVRELPGEGLAAVIQGRRVLVTGRGSLAKTHPELIESLPAISAGMECIVIVDRRYAAAFRFRDEPRPEGARFIGHLAPKHHVRRIMLVSGDREAEVADLAGRVGIKEVFAGQSPEQKLAIVRGETEKAPTMFLGDGINDAPALTAATVGIAFGNNSEITGEAADAVILDSTLEKVDVLFHIGQRMRGIALQSAVGGMGLSLVGMLLAATGHLPPVAGAVSQEIIDVLAVVNALRAAFPPAALSDY